MSSGVRLTETYSGSDDVATLVRLSVSGESDGGAATVMPFRTPDRAPGERFKYASAETRVLGLVLRASTGKPLAEYLSEKIWQPMGAEADASWLIDKGGYEAAYVGVNATVRDYARLGMLLANDGALDRRQIIPASWVRAATTPPAPQFQPGQANPFFGYGYPDMDPPRQGAAVRAAGPAGAKRVGGPEVGARDGPHRGARRGRPGNRGADGTLVRRRERTRQMRRTAHDSRSERAR
jgi:CubicO group peptidase (beta-lactamase class C family)